MKVVITHPYCWPHVRRGSERFIDGLSAYLTRQGHDVVTLSTHPEGARIENNEQGRRILFSPRARPWMKKFRIDETHLFYFTAEKALREMQADAVHSIFYIDAVAAARTKPQHRGKVILQLHGVAVGGVSCHRWFPPEGWLFGEAMKRSDERIACSSFIRDQGREHYNVDSIVIPPPLEVRRFPIGPGALQRPTFLSAADFNVRRKGVRVLVKAFAQLKQQIPDALLRLSGRISDEVRHEILRDLPDKVRRDIEILGLGKPEDLPLHYGSANVTVLPAMWEPSGMVLFESWACGTPIVTTNHAGVPEFVAAGTGILFEPLTNAEETNNVEGLMQAMLAGLQLSQEPGVRSRCRALAEQYSFEAVGPRIEQLYRTDSVPEVAYSAR
jgi:phosphatidyl-myo-inositol alpha-mannosyltransferase